MAIGLDPGILAGPHRDPDSAVEGRLNGAGYRARIAIPHYGARIEKHYGRKLNALAIGFPFRHFGLSIDFAKPVELAVHEDARRLDDGLRALLRRFGSLTIRNACLPEPPRAGAQRNVFQSLSFHIDRGRGPGRQHLAILRDPFDPA